MANISVSVKITQMFTCLILVHVIVSVIKHEYGEYLGIENYPHVFSGKVVLACQNVILNATFLLIKSSMYTLSILNLLKKK